MTRVTALTGHTNWVRCAAFLVDGTSRVVTGSNDYSLRIWNYLTGACLVVMPRTSCTGKPSNAV